MANEDQVEELKRWIEEQRKPKLDYYKEYNKSRDKEYWKKRYQKSKESGAYQKQLANQKEKKRLRRQDPEYRTQETQKILAANKRKKEERAGRPKPTACEVCGAGGKIVFDHCHDSDKFRGWLCHNCNVIIGLAHDDAPLLDKLAVYLRTHNA